MGQYTRLQICRWPTAEEAFSRKQEAFKESRCLQIHRRELQEFMVQCGLKQHSIRIRKTRTEKLYLKYNNEKFPEILPHDSATRRGYNDSERWPEVITRATTPAAVCRIGIMKSQRGGESWKNKGISIGNKKAPLFLTSLFF